MVFAVVALMAAGACGGGDDGNDAGGGGGDDRALTKAQFVEQGNAVCEQGQAEFEKIFETDFPSTPEKAPGFFAKAVPVVEKQLTDLRALEPPEADRKAIEALLADGDKALEDFRKASKDQELAIKLFGEEGGANLTAFNEKAEAYGLTACAEDEGDEAPQKADPATFSPEKRAFVEKADAVCAALQEKLAPIEESTFATFPPPLAQWAKGLPQIVAVLRPGLAELRKLTPPKGDEARIDELFDARQEVVDSLDKAGSLAAAGNQAEFDKAITPIFMRAEEIDKELVEYGFQICGSEDEGEEGEE